MTYEKMSRSLRYYFEHRKFCIMQKGEESSIKYNYRFTRDGLIKVCHLIGWEQVRKYAVTTEQQQGLDELQAIYQEKMEAPSPATSGGRQDGKSDDPITITVATTAAPTN